MCYRADLTMPKEADHLEGGGDKEPKEEEEGTQDAPEEETVRKRVRENTPSPHGENTPQGEERSRTRTHTNL